MISQDSSRAVGNKPRVALTLELPVGCWTRVERLWKWLKQRRKIRFGPIALAFFFDRNVPVTKNSKNRLSEHATSRSGAERPSREVALIVGAGPGLGHALARRLSVAGSFHVVLASRRAHRLDELVGEIRSDGGSAAAYGCDATSESSVRELFEHLPEPPSLVVYAPQQFTPGALVDIELPAFVDAWKCNCLGAFLVARAAARSMLPQKRGTIVFIGSTSSLVGRAGHLNLAVGKFGQRAIAQVLARELWPAGIHVAHIVIDADIAEGAGEEAQADPDDISRAVLSLHCQPRTAWSSEIDVRPWNERFWEHC